ncbi:hypothetical protein KFK09_017172 [Dendrobium nobile]|uniref:non-specific serine/threonine protein kinase n=1 Tax=Dendrobium nobile TaxID=94219 RepID=A0A8T3B6P3_DENNO|nr:hypothetical protein KFK09_017172 [Dendrobium nobile]
MASILAFLILVASPFAEAAVGESVRGVSRICSSDRVGYLRLQDGYRVFVTGQQIDDRVLMCEALAFFLASKCLEFDSRVEEWGEIARKYCARNFKYIAGLDHDAVSGEVFHTAGRKLLLQPQKDSSKLDQLSRKQLSKYEVKDLRLKIPPKSKFLAFPGLFLLCCAVICPCFRARRKEPIEQKALANETNSSDSVTPLDVSASPDKNLTTPHKVPQSPSRFSLSPQQNRIGSLQLTVNQIIKATQNFSPSLKLGEGGFGTVYKGILGDGQIVAVKRAKKVITFYLFIIVLILIFIQTTSLHGHILDFNQRLEIAIDVAHALTYLHVYAEKTIIHRDVKASNILLTENFRAKVSDFGFARTGPSEAGQTHISTKVKGTAGYLDPEYLRTYQLTPKSDVFSFGILLIEILSARRPVEMKRIVDERITVRWAFSKFDAGNVREVLDPKLQEDVNLEVVTKMLSLAFHCAAPTRAKRPLMKEVGEQLWEIRKDFGKSLRTE